MRVHIRIKREKADLSEVSFETILKVAKDIHEDHLLEGLLPSLVPIHVFFIRNLEIHGM